MQKNSTTHHQEKELLNGYNFQIYLTRLQQKPSKHFTL